MHNKEEVLEKLRQLQPFFSKEGVLLLGVFGSLAREETDSHSDIDVLIETTPMFTQNYRGFGYFAKLEEMKEFLEKELHSPVDIVDKAGLLQHNNFHILQSAVYV